MRKLPGYKPGDYVYVRFSPDLVERLAREAGVVSVGFMRQSGDIRVERAEGSTDRSIKSWTYVAWATFRGFAFADELRRFDERLRVAAL